MKKCFCGTEMTAHHYKNQWVCHRCGRTKPIEDDLRSNGMPSYNLERAIELMEHQIEKLTQDNERLRDELSKEGLQREVAEKRYFELCQRCINLYVSEKNITTDTVFVQIGIPAFLSDEDLETAIVKTLVSRTLAERNRAILFRRDINHCKVKHN